MILFQVVFGMAVFAVTRQYYIQDLDRVGNDPAVTGHPSLDWPDSSQESGTPDFVPVFPEQMMVQDPALKARQADELFTKQQYGDAAVLYEQLLAMDPSNVNTYNNLGITLHYLDRSAEALNILNEGVTVDSTYQRIWLTLGYVNSQLGNTEQARKALNTAVQLDAGSDVGQSAANMLENLPQEPAR
jgi:Flp pilus assembly protein TadD